MKIPCPHCETKVIRKLMDDEHHNCFVSCTMKLDKVERTLEYADKRFRQQSDCRDKFDHVILNVKKKTAMLNKKLETLFFSQTDFRRRDRVNSFAKI